MPLELDFLLEQLELRVKSGRRSAKDLTLLNAIHKAAVELGATQCKGIVEEETDTNKDEEEKSRAGVLSPLTLPQLRAKLADLEISILAN